MTAPTYKLSIVRGKTLEQPLLYAGNSLEYRAIQAISSVAPVTLQVTGHGIPVNWPVRIQSVVAPTELNTPSGMSLLATPIDANTLELNALEGSTWAAHDGSGYVVFNSPMDLTGWKARMQVRNNIGGTVLLSLSSDPADNADGVIEVDAAASAFILKLTAEQTAALEWSGAVYDLEAVRPDGTVLSILAPSVVVVDQEVTVWQ